MRWYKKRSVEGEVVIRRMVNCNKKVAEDNPCTWQTQSGESGSTN